MKLQKLTLKIALTDSKDCYHPYLIQIFKFSIKFLSIICTLNIRLFIATYRNKWQHIRTGTWSIWCQIMFTKSTNIMKKLLITNPSESTRKSRKTDSGTKRIGGRFLDFLLKLLFFLMKLRTTFVKQWN
jgi:hypothetical protein